MRFAIDEAQQARTEEGRVAFTAVYLKSVVFEEEKREAEALIAGKDVVRESFVI